MSTVFKPQGSDLTPRGGRWRPPTAPPWVQGQRASHGRAFEARGAFSRPRPRPGQDNQPTDKPTNQTTVQPPPPPNHQAWITISGVFPYARGGTRGGLVLNPAFGDSLARQPLGGIGILLRKCGFRLLGLGIGFQGTRLF